MWNIKSREKKIKKKQKIFRYYKLHIENFPKSSNPSDAHTYTLTQEPDSSGSTI